MTSTLVTSIAGAATYLGIAVATGGTDIGPDWAIGLSCGVGGLVGGYLGAHVQPRLPERGLRFALGGVAIVTAGTYAVQAL